MEPHQLRVIEERDELKEKADKLSAFIGTALFMDIEKEERDKLHEQLTVVNVYLSILNDRIDNFK